MAGDQQSGKKQPSLKIVDHREDDEEVTRLGQSPGKPSPPRKKAALRRSQEATALVRDLTEQEAVKAPEESPLEEELEANAPAPPIHIPPVFFALAAGAFLLLLALGVFLAMGGRDGKKNDRSLERSRENLQQAEQDQEEARALLEEIKSTLEKYTSAKTVAEKSSLVRQPERVRPLMEDYYNSRRLIPEIGARLIGQYALPIKNRSFVVLTVEFDDESQRILLAEVDNDLNVTIDWESDVCYQPVDLEEYIQNKPTEPVTLRVFAKPDNFYVFEFSDSDKYQCLRLTFRDEDALLFGYVQRSSAVSERMASYFKKSLREGGVRAEPVMLKVRFLENSKADQGVLIEEFIAPRWANIDEFQDEQEE